MTFRSMLKELFDEMLTRVAAEVRRDLLAPRKARLRLADVRAWEAALQQAMDEGAAEVALPWREARIAGGMNAHDPVSSLR